MGCLLPHACPFQTISNVLSNVSLAHQMHKGCVETAVVVIPCNLEGAKTLLLSPVPPEAAHAPPLNCAPLISILSLSRPFPPFTCAPPSSMHSPPFACVRHLKQHYLPT